MTSLYFVNIEVTDGAYMCLLREVYASKSYAAFPVLLGSDNTLTIKGETVTLGSLVRKLADYQAHELDRLFDDRGQLGIGSYLFDQIFSPLTKSERLRLRSAKVEVRIVTKDEHIAQLPWSLLTDGEVFLTTERWSVALSASEEECADCLLPPSPRLLFVTPQPTGWGATEADDHIAELETQLTVANPLHVRNKHLRIVETWDDFTATLKSFRPHILYYYGHGTADLNASRLIFSGGDAKAARPIPVADFANLLRSLENDYPSIVYVNCCKGDVGGMLGVGLQLASFIPAVITNCTAARVDAAREQAKTVWKNILISGVAPHEAVICMRRRVAEANFSFNDVRWITPVLHYRYKKWEFKPPANELRLQLKPNWENMLDRTRQTGEVILRLGSLLQAQKRRPALAFLWHGHEGQGVEQFYHRLEIELQDRFSDVAFCPVAPAWPQELHNFHRSISDMLTQAFEVATLAEIPYKVRFEMLRKGARQSIVYLRHPSLSGETALSHPNQLRNYLEWLDKNLAAHIDESTCLLIGFAFEENARPDSRSQAVFQRELFEALEDIEFGHLTFYVLEELGKVTRRDLVDFMRVQNYQLPTEIREQIIAGIMKKTDGHYQQVLEELKEML
jgi:CHAT domain